MEKANNVGNLKTITTRAELANLLNVDYKQFCYFLYAKNRDKLYTTFYVKKKDGSNRRIDAPGKWLKMIQRRLSRLLFDIYIPKPFVFGFIPKRSYEEGAKNHIKKSFVINVDLEDFFFQINFGRVRGILLSKPYCLNEEVATTIAQIACYKNVLPQGSPCSPIITNIVCKPFDNSLRRVAEERRSRYKRYADDLTFSTYREELPSFFAIKEEEGYVIGSGLSAAIEEAGFVINQRKFKVFEKTDRQEVTGLTVNKKVNVNKKYMKRIRALLYNCLKHGVYESARRYVDLGFCKRSDIQELIRTNEKQDVVTNWFLCVLHGMLSFIRQIRGNDDLLFQSLAYSFNLISSKQYFNVSKLEQANIAIVNNVFLLKPIDTGNQGSCFLLKDCLMTCYHVLKGGTRYEVVMCSSNGEVVLGTINVATDLISYDEKIDFAVVKFREIYLSFPIGDSRQLKVEDEITIAGFPDYTCGDTINIQGCRITSLSKLFDTPLYTISGRVVHGSSGGIVLNKDRNIIGIIKAGVQYEDLTDTTVKQGFIPIHLALDRLPC